MKTKDIKDFTDQQLKEKIAEERLSFTRMRLQHSISPLDNPMKLKQAKRAIARLLTEQKSRALKASKAAK